MTAIAKALLHRWTVFWIVTAETLNNRTKLANIMNHPLGRYEYVANHHGSLAGQFLPQDILLRTKVLDRKLNGQTDWWIVQHNSSLPMLTLGILVCVPQNGANKCIPICPPSSLYVKEAVHIWYKIHPEWCDHTGPALCPSVNAAPGLEWPLGIVHCVQIKTYIDGTRKYKV